MKPKGQRRVTDRERLSWILKNCHIFLEFPDPPSIYERKDIDAAILASREGKS